MNKRSPTCAYEQLQCPHPDVVAFRIRNGINNVLIWSVYITPVDFRFPITLQSIQSTLDTIDAVIREHANDATQPAQLLLAGDFNPHHPAWTSSEVPERMMLHAKGLVNFTQTHGLQSCLPRAISAYWSTCRLGQRSTLDLTLSNFPGSLIKCGLYDDNFGSDPRATASEWQIHVGRRDTQPARKAFEKANWSKIGAAIQTRLSPHADIDTVEKLEEVADTLVSATAATVEEHVPKAQPCPYSKRWFTPGSKSLYTHARIAHKPEVNCEEPLNRFMQQQRLAMPMSHSHNTFRRQSQQASPQLFDGPIRPTRNRLLLHPSPRLPFARSKIIFELPSGT